MAAPHHHASVLWNSLQNVEKQGYLKKRGDMLHSWRNRYFVLKDSILFYFVDANTKEPRYINLFNGKFIRGMFVLQDAKVEDEQKVKASCFSVQVTKHASMLMGDTMTHGVFFFEAPSPKEKKEWIIALRKATRLSMQAVDDKISVKLAWKEYLKTNQIILVTCAASRIGVKTIRYLLLRGVRVRALVHNEKEVAKLKNDFGSFIEITSGDLFKDTVLSAALKGVSKLLIITPSSLQLTKFVHSLLQCAQNEKSLQHIVKISDWSEKFPTPIGKMHHIAEQFIQKTKFTWTVVRMNACMSNFKSYFAPDVLQKKSFALPLSPHVKVSYVSMNDVAAVLAQVISDDAHIGKTYNITGPEALSCGEIADIITKCVGHPIAYEKIAIETFQKELLDAGLPPWAIESVADLYRFQEQYNDHARVVNPDVQQILGRPAQPMRDYIMQEIDSFGGVRKPVVCIVTTHGRDFLNTCGIDGMLVHQLLESGARVRLIQYKPNQAKKKPVTNEWSRYGVENVDFECYQGELIADWTKVLNAPVDDLVLLTSYTEDIEEREKKIVDQAKKAGVSRILKLSFIASDTPDICKLTTLHHNIEKHIKQSGVHYTIIRSNMCYQALAAFTRQIGGEMVNFLAMMGRGKVSFCDGMDTIRAMVEVLLCDDPNIHVGKTYNITGPEELSIEEIQQIISDTCNTKLMFDFHYNKGAKTDDEMKTWMDMLSEVLKRCNEGYFAILSKDFETLTGGSLPRTFVEWVSETNAKSLFTLAKK